MFGIDSKLYEFLSKIADLIIVNLLFIICSLPIVTIGASTTALYGVTKKMASNSEGYIFRSYFKLFKENFKQSTIMWIILLVLSLIPTADLYIINYMPKGLLPTVLRGFMLAAALAILFVFLYAMALQSTFENTVKNTLKNAFLMGIGHFPWTLLIVTITLLMNSFSKSVLAFEPATTQNMMLTITEIAAVAIPTIPNTLLLPFMICIIPKMIASRAVT